MTKADPESVDVEQFANETVRLTASITRVMNAPDILTGEVSGSGKTIAVTHPNREDTTFRLDTATIMAGESEFRDSWGFELYTPERFQSTQTANYGPGPQAGANGVTDAEDLPDATHTPVGEDADSEDDDSEDPDGDADAAEDSEDAPSADDEDLIEHYRQRFTDATEDELVDIREDLMGYLREARESGQTGNVDELRAKVRAVARELDSRESGENGGADGGSPDANPGDEGGQTVMTDGGVDVDGEKPVSQYDDFDGSRRTHAELDETEMLHLLELAREGDELLLNERSRALTVTDVYDSDHNRTLTLTGNGTTYNLIVERNLNVRPTHAALRYASGMEPVTAAKVTNRNPLNVHRYDQLTDEEMESVAPAHYSERHAETVERTPGRSLTDYPRHVQWGEWELEGDELTAAKWATWAFVQNYREGALDGISEDALDTFQNALAMWESVREWDVDRGWTFHGQEMSHLGAYLDYAVESPGIRGRIPDAAVDAADALREGEDVPDLSDVPQPEGGHASEESDADGEGDPEVRTDGGEDEGEDSDLTYPRQALCPRCDRQADASEFQKELPTPDGGSATVVFEKVTCPTCGLADVTEPFECPTVVHGQDLMSEWGPSEGERARVVYDANRGGEKDVTLTVRSVAGGTAGIVRAKDDAGHSFMVQRDAGELSRQSDGGSWSVVGDIILAVPGVETDAGQPVTDGGGGPTARELMEQFGYTLGEPPNPIHGEVTDELDKYGHPYIFIGSRESYNARKEWLQKLDAAGYEYHHPEDGRFSEGEDIRIAVVTGRSDS